MKVKLKLIAMVIDKCNESENFGDSRRAFFPLLFN